MIDQLPHKTAGGRGMDLLAGVRVLDLTSSIAGPYATWLLGAFGAEVVKVEPKRGDEARAWGPPFLEGESLWFASVNANKRSIACDYLSSAGKALLLRLAAVADVLVTNQLEFGQRKAGIDPGALCVAHPRFIHVSITGFGIGGRRGERPCYDLIAEGYSGIMDLTGEADSPPQKVGTPAADMLAGMDAALAIVAALVRRGRTGKGATIDISMVESMTRFLAPRLVAYMGSGEVSRRSGGRDSVIAIYQTFETADAPITLGLGSDAIWSRFWRALGDTAYAEDARFASNAGRREARAAIVARIQAVLCTRPRAHWLALFEEHRIPAGPINRMDEVCADADLIERGLFYAVDGQGARVPQVGLGVRIDGSSDTHRSPPPRLGEHTETVLREILGLPSAECEALRRDGVI